MEKLLKHRCDIHHVSMRPATMPIIVHTRDVPAIKCPMCNTYLLSEIALRVCCINNEYNETYDSVLEKVLLEHQA